MEQTIIFDFDGTIANTLEAAVEAYNILAPRYRCRTIRPDDLYRLREGRPRELMTEFEVNAWKLPFLVAGVRKGLKGRKLVAQDGIVEVIKSLHNKGATLGILTSNSRENVDAFLEANDLLDTFAFISSYRHLFGKHKALVKIVKIRHLNNTEVSYIGDEVRDVEAAKRAGVRSVGVTWGFQTQGALEAAQPDVIATTPINLFSLTKHASGS